MGNTKDLYIQHMPRVRILYQKEAEKQLSIAEKEELYGLRKLLFESIKKYGFSLVHGRITGIDDYKDHGDIMRDMEGVLFISFCKGLNKYNTAFAPTTYFKFWFYGAISQYFAFRKGTTPYYLQGINRLEKCREKNEERGLICTIGMLSKDTGIKEGVVRNTLLIERRMQQVSPDEIYFVNDERLNPEEVVIEKEKKEILRKRVKRCLSDEEYAFFYQLFYIESLEKVSYKKMAEATGYTQQAAKRLWRSITKKIKEMYKRKE